MAPSRTSFQSDCCASPRSVAGAELRRTPLARRELDQLPRLVVAQRQRLLAVHVLAGRERLPTDVRVRLRRSQVDDQLDGVICEQLVEVRIGAAAELGDKALGRPGSTSVAATSSSPSTAPIRSA